jgi:hypothetical protein
MHDHASLRATATVALLWLARLLILMPQVLTLRLKAEAARPWPRSRHVRRGRAYQA